MSHTPPGDYGGRDRLSPDLYEESETDPGADEPPARIFVALFDYDPLSMSPNPDAAEELPFKEGQIIKVGAQRGAGRTAGPGTGGAQQAARTRRATGTPGSGRPAAVRSRSEGPHRTPVATPRATTRGPRQCRGLTPATPGPGHRLPADGAVCGGPTRPRGTSMWGGGAGGPPCRPLAV